MTTPNTVLKFGGTSVQDAEAISRLVSIVKNRPGKKLVVVSALAKVTDRLLELAKQATTGKLSEALPGVQALASRHEEIIQNLKLSSALSEQIRASFSQLAVFLQSLEALGECSARSLDRIVSIGELCSSQIVADACRSMGLSAEWLDSREIMLTDSGFGSAQVQSHATEEATRKRVGDLWRTQDVVVCGGFIGSTELNGQKVPTTLGRGGSDYSAAVFGAALGSQSIEIWTDVDGILTTDPRMVPEAKRIRKLSFDEAAELAFFGAKVLHPATIYPAVKKEIPVWVLNSRNPTCEGTEITETGNSGEGIVKALACKRNITLVNIHSTRMLGAAGFLKTVFEVFARHGVSIDLISTSEVNISLTLDPQTNPQSLKQVTEELGQIAKVTVETAMASVAVVGKGMRHATGLGARVFGALSGVPVFMISMGSSEVNLSLVVREAQVIEVIRKLHSSFFEQSAASNEIFATS
jgi:aspartate kinase